MIDDKLKRKLRRYKPYIVRFVFPVLTLFIVVIAKKLLHYGTISPYSFFSIAIVVQAIWSGIWPAIITSFLSIAFVNYYFIEPIYRIQFNTEDQIFQASTYLLQSILLSILVGGFFSNRKRLRALVDSLNVSTQKFRNIIDNIFTLIIITDQYGEIIEANKPYAEMLPGKWDDLLEKKIYNVHPWRNDPEARSRLRKAFKDVLKTDVVKYDEVLSLDNKIRYCELTITAIRKDDKKNSIDNIVLTVKDTTDRKLYEKELLKSKDVVTKLIDSDIVGMVLKNSQGLIKDANHTFLRLTGYTEKEVEEGKVNWYKINADQEHKFVGEHTTEIDIRRKDGEIVPVLTSKVPINKDEDLNLRIIVDLTLQKNIQKKKDEFISIASHELKTPMTIIKGYLQLLNKKLEKDNIDYSAFLKSINFQLDKLNTLVNELHDMSKMESDKLRMNVSDVNINELVKESVEAVLPFTDKHKIEIVEEFSPLIIQGDVVRLEQVLVNLLTNAIKYSKPATTILVELKKEDDEAVVTVKDRGIGIPQDQLPNIFKKFFQVESKSELKEGLGLGLYISSQIIKKHNGKISVDSVEGEGSEFSFRIPLVRTSSS